MKKGFSILVILDQTVQLMYFINLVIDSFLDSSLPGK